ncbi:response regulator [Acidisoma sp. S159]|uniref:response regulator n=1 Tax=Acidisoma sp. S159 TaxID=1747225 RepID=UPI00131BAC2E|nr:response regulator transcription factor [Acidisoma sp. S159]
MDAFIHLLVIDNDEEIRNLIKRALEDEGFAVTVARDAREARRAWTREAFRLVVLDLTLPGESGLDLALWLREQADVPIVMLNAVGDEIDRVIGIELGADDYIAKPFNSRELIARIQAILRRKAQNRAGFSRDRILRPRRFEGWTLEPARRRLINRDGVEVPLTVSEYDLLLALLDSANCVLTRNALLELVHGRQAAAFDRAIDVAIGRLRRKLGDQRPGGQMIRTIRSGGYMLAAQVERL